MARIDCLNIFDDILVVQLLQQIYLKCDCLLVVGLESVHRNHLYRHSLPCLAIDSPVYPAERPTPNDVLELVLTHRLGLLG